MLRIPEGSCSKRSYTGCSINLNFVMFIILQLLMWVTLGRFKLLVIRFWHGSVCLWWQRRRPAWLRGWAWDVQWEKKPVHPWWTTKSHNSSFLFKQQMLSSKTPCWFGVYDFMPIHGHTCHSLAQVLRIWHLYYRQKDSSAPERQVNNCSILSSPLASVHVAKAAWKLLPSTPLLSSVSQGFECPCSPNCGSSAGMNEAFSRTRLYEWDRLCITRQEAPWIS